MPDSAATRSAGRLHPRDRARPPTATSACSRWRLPPSPSKWMPPLLRRSTSPKRAFLVILFVATFLGATAVIYGTPGVASAAKPQCNNRTDDDGDGKIDYPTDPGCNGRGDKSEVDPIQPPPPPGDLVREDMALIVYGGSSDFAVETNVDKFGTCNVSFNLSVGVANKPCRGLIYSASFHAPDDDLGQSYWADDDQARANGWLLHNSSGGELVCGGQYQFDVGDPGYQQEWITRVNNQIDSLPGIEGTFTDGVTRTPPCNQYPREYPTQALWDAAMVEWSSVVGPALQNISHYQVVNAGGWCAACGNEFTSTQYWWTQLDGYFPAVNFEHWTVPSGQPLATTGTAWYQQWNERRALVSYAQNLGFDFYAIDRWSNSDLSGKAYGRVTFLLDWDGSGGGHFQTPSTGYGGAESNWVAGMPSYDVGVPVTAKAQTGVAWKREYSKAWVAINPAPSASQMITLGSQAITLGPVSATIVLK
jgi:hypothetical protein